MYKPTRQKLPNSAYWDHGVFDAECNFLQTSTWTMVGLKRDLPNSNDFITANVAGRPVTIQNFGGVLKAFDNICSHRHCLIRKEERGRGPLRCPYHSWTYDSAGVPISIPVDDAFEFRAEEREKLALYEWQVAFCGELIFVCASFEALSLEDQLGAAFSDLSELSGAFGVEVDRIVSDYDANWKICVENTLDEYHARFVHPTTFRHILGNDFYYDYAAFGSNMRAPAIPDYLAKWAKVERLLGPMPTRTQDYFHYHLFPTTTFASSFGASFSVQQFTPLGPAKTRLVSRLFFATSKASENIIASLAESAKEFNQVVFEEDRIICNQVQEGIQHSRQHGVIGKYEQRIAHFQESLKKILPIPQYDVQP